MVDRYFSDADLAALYDRFSPPSRRKDFAFYAPLAMSAGAVLDVGCGTGSFLHRLRDAGHGGRLVGLDPGAGMIAQARRRTDIEWVLADLSQCAWKGEFDFVVTTGHAFQTWLADEEIGASLAAIRAAIGAGGRLAFETRNPTAREWERWKPDLYAEVSGPDGETVRLSREVVAPFDGRTLTFTLTFSSSAWDRERVSSSTLRFLDTVELDGFLREAGFGVEAQYGDWDRSPVTSQSPEIITLARRL